LSRLAICKTLSFTFIVACAQGELPPHGSSDARNPQAVEGATMLPAAPTAIAATADGGSAVYACPMHPEVTSDRPGKCPKCGMTFVKREAK
jgi:hypothetical protein